MKVSNEPIDPAILKALQTIKEQEALEQKFIQWQEIDDICEEFSEINDLVCNLGSKNSDFDQANDWLIKNRDGLTPEKLQKIIYISMLHGRNRHSEDQAKDDQIRDLWKVYEAKGMSKTQAAKLIAPIVEAGFEA